MSNEVVGDRKNPTYDHKKFTPNFQFEKCQEHLYSLLSIKSSGKLPSDTVNDKKISGTSEPCSAWTSKKLTISDNTYNDVQAIS